MQTSNSLFNVNTLNSWAQRASTDSFVHEHSVLANLCFALRNTQTNEHAWLLISNQKVQAGLGKREVSFYLEGDSAAFSDLIQGFPFNRLIRQHKLVVSGDLRACVQNWMLLYALTKLISDLENSSCLT